MRSLNAAPASDDGPIRLDVAPDMLSLFWVDNIAIMVWHSSPSAALVEELHRSAEPRRRQFPGGMSFVHIGRVQLAMLDTEARDVFVRISRELQGYMAAVVFFAKASGFLASTLRSIVTGVLVLARSTSEVHYCDDVETLLTWLLPKHTARTGVTIDVERLRRVLVEATSLR
jgi:hypothetical protein